MSVLAILLRQEHDVKETAIWNQRWLSSSTMHNQGTFWNRTLKTDLKNNALR